MSIRTAVALVAAVVASAVFSTGSARADAIDGNWCHADGRRLSIQGRTIVTPGGKLMEGDYSRHGFAYAAPDGEAHAGQTIAMQLRSETLVEAQAGPAGSLETWRRCAATTS